MSKNRIAIDIDYHDLKELLGLPGDIEIVGHTNFDFSQSLSIVIDGPGLENQPTGCFPYRVVGLKGFVSYLKEREINA